MQRREWFPESESLGAFKAEKPAGRWGRQEVKGIQCLPQGADCCPWGKGEPRKGSALERHDQIFVFQHCSDEQGLRW